MIDEKLSIITPWLNAPELIQSYEHTVAGTEAIVIDNGSDPETAAKLESMIARLDGIYIRNDTNRGYATANNQGFRASHGGIVMFLNNDTYGLPNWTDRVYKDVRDAQLYGPSWAIVTLNGHPYSYIEGWCIAAPREVWNAITIPAAGGPWDDQYYTGLYWEDSDLNWRAQQAGIGRRGSNWTINHKGNYTSRKTPGAYDHSFDNRALLEQRVRETLE